MDRNKKNGKIIRFADVEQLQNRIAEQSPKSGQYFYDYKLEEAQKQKSQLLEQQFHAKYKINFADLPISQSTLKGLNNKGFNKMTQVQRCSILHALAGRDLLVSSRTGSGKTLAYLVPLVQKLYRNKFIPIDGLGAIVIVPVRQLAMQVFQVLNSFTQKMQISVGLIIGGKDVKYQKQRIKMMNILICTPGRLLQHLEETYGFQTSNLQMLVLDQADVMLQMGFKQPLKAILEQIPRTQTLMFSATMTKDIIKLASICTSEPQKILLQGVNIERKQKIQTEEDKGIYEAPAKLQQYYMVVEAQDKINTFYSFLKTHQKQKIIVFVSTCKQVRFLYQAFRKFKMGSPLYELQGHQKQKKRMAIYFTFCQKRYGVLICTNIAARGLDFPMVDWVLQVDAPQNADIYVHRVGRTARYKAQGKSLLLLAPHQIPFVQQLKAKKLQVHKITQNPQRFLRVQSSLESICSEHQDVKYLAQRALISYLKFLHKHPNRKVFNYKQINLQQFAHSFGLPSAPVISQNKNMEESEEQQEQQKVKLSKIQKLRMKQKQKKIAQKIKKSQLHNQQNIQQNQQQQQEEEVKPNKITQLSNDHQLFKIKEVIRHNGEKAPLSTSKRQLKKVKSQGHFQGRNKVYFDDQGNTIPAEEYNRKLKIAANRQQIETNTIDLLNKRLYKNKEQDQQIQKLRRKDRRRKIQTQRQISKKGQSRVAVLDQQDQQDFQ